ncbi:Uncharacterised protein [Bordetella ansorpii]|uniref:Uncharacterized protein n=1 Tax=Bordetella ansorpii TaxID=288768 RepID=A0A157RB56_9BORD|nr:hypothetical protein [Bordetella ansorpii]SAI55285.1 Uncharacterised protein [Bordetella ansorpii]
MYTPVIDVAAFLGLVAIALAAIVTLTRSMWPRRRLVPPRGQFVMAISDQPNAMSAWCATYTQASLVELEAAKVIMVIMGAMLVVSTTVASVWPGATLPAATIVVLAVGQLIGALPLVALTEAHQDRLDGLAASMAFPLGDQSHLRSIALPAVSQGKIARACVNLALAVICLSAAVLAIQIGIATSTPECVSGEGVVIWQEITVCAVDHEKINARANR